LTTTLIDMGPIVAFLNARDRHHSWALSQMANLRPPLETCDGVLSEATYLLRGRTGGPEAVLDLLGRGVLRASFRIAEEVGAVRKLLTRYSTIGMELADACLVRMAELHPECVLVTIDSEFRDVYRRSGRQVIPTLLPPGVARRRR
jgi:predicted nucleic acid-binding protein